MEIMLLIMAAVYAVGSKNNKDTSTAAYKAGKEPPGLAKARMQHEAGGGRFVTRPGKNGTKTSKAKGPGATRLAIASHWANACEKSKTKGEDRLRRWMAWYQEQAPKRDEDWRAKQRKKLERKTDRLERWQNRWSRTKTATGDAVNTMTGRGRGEQDTTGENSGMDQANVDPSAATDPSAEPAAGEQSPAGLADQAGQASDTTQTTEKDEETDEPETDTENTDSGGTAATTATTQSNTLGEIVDYQQAADALRAAAERVEQYRDDLADMADGLGGKHWGEEVHGTLRDMDGALQETAADYRDLATEMEQAGDAIRDAEDAHPYVPGREVVDA